VRLPRSTGKSHSPQGRPWFIHLVGEAKGGGVASSLCATGDIIFTYSRDGCPTTRHCPFTKKGTLTPWH